MAKSGDGADSGSEERKKTNVDVENKLFDASVLWAGDTSCVLVCYGGVGERAKRLVSSRHKHLRSRLNPSQVNR